MALSPIPPVVFATLVLQGLTGGVLGPAVAAISLGLVGHAALAETLGRNQRFASAGALIVTGLMGAIGYFLSYRAIFFVSATLVLPLLVAVARVHSADIHFGCSCGQPDHHASTPPRAKRLSLSKNYNLLTFAACLFLFQFANASMFGRFVYRLGTDHPATDRRGAECTLGGTIGSELGCADLTNRTGRFNLAQGFVGMLAGIGAS
jgi:hypothetical protein